MKTKEFIKEVKKLGYEKVDVARDRINIIDYGLCKASVSLKIEKDIFLDTGSYSIVKLIVEYADTPIEEREEEKLYTVVLHDPKRRGRKVMALGKLEEHRNEVIIQKVKKETLNCDRCKLTESEIKENHAYLWQFAKEVE